MKSISFNPKSLAALLVPGALLLSNAAKTQDNPYGGNPGRSGSYVAKFSGSSRWATAVCYYFFFKGSIR